MGGLSDFADSGVDRRRRLCLTLSVKRRLHALLGVQVVLGALASFWIYVVSGGMLGPVSMGEAIFATLHVAVGAMLLAQTLAAAMWARRLICTQPADAVAGLEGAR